MEPQVLMLSFLKRGKIGIVKERLIRRTGEKEKCGGLCSAQPAVRRRSVGRTADCFNRRRAPGIRAWYFF